MSKKLILDVKNLTVKFTLQDDKRFFWQPKQSLTAVNNISFELYEGETLGIVGESGCGKSTLARALIGLVNATSGSALWLGQDLTQLMKPQWHTIRRDIQMVFQDPLASLNPRMTVGNIIAEPLKTHFPNLSSEDIKAKVTLMMNKVGLLPNMINRYPHEFSGGQCQRIGIARALILEPKLVICDEPVSALDVSIQAQVVNLLKSLQKEMNLSLLFIAHDLSIVKHISDRVMVMYLGNVVELGSSEDVFTSTKHPYTKALMSAVPIADPDMERNKQIQLLEGELPSPINPPAGCVFSTRCPNADQQCSLQLPTLKMTNQHSVACLKII